MRYVQLERFQNQCIVFRMFYAEHKVCIKNNSLTAKIEAEEEEENILKSRCQDCAASEDNFY